MDGLAEVQETRVNWDMRGVLMFRTGISKEYYRRLAAGPCFPVEKLTDLHVSNGACWIGLDTHGDLWVATEAQNGWTYAPSDQETLAEELAKWQGA